MIMLNINYVYKFNVMMIKITHGVQTYTYSEIFEHMFLINGKN